MRDFEKSARLGDEGMGTFNIGSLLAVQGRHEEALAAFDRAEKEGYKLYNLPFQRGLSLIALGRVKEGSQQMQVAVQMNPPSPIREIAFMHIGRAEIQLGEKKLAIYALQSVLEKQPRNGEARYLLGLAYVMSDQPQKAREVLDGLVRDEPTANAYYARALANYSLHHKNEAAADIDAAVRMGLNNANVREWQAKIRKMP
jgi:tetratricopeptide (TPR) repeat protein